LYSYKLRITVNTRMWSLFSSTTLRNSNFYTIYNETKKIQTYESIQESLQKISPNFSKSFSDEYKKTNSVEDTCITCWTLEDPKFYSVLKGVIATDNEDELKLWMPFIRGLAHGLNEKNPSQMITYRGSRSPNMKIIVQLSPGTLFRMPYFVAASTNRDKAKDFGSIVEFHIPDRCPNARLIQYLSKFEEESEVLLPPYTLVRVITNDSAYGVCNLKLEVLDNREYRSDMHYCYSLDLIKRPKNHIKELAVGAMVGGTLGVLVGKVKEGVAIGAALCLLQNYIPKATESREAIDDTPEEFNKFCD